jgi:hypothetical protein
LLPKPIPYRSIIVALFQQPSGTTIKHLAALGNFVIFRLPLNGVIQGVKKGTAGVQLFPRMGHSALSFRFRGVTLSSGALKKRGKMLPAYRPIGNPRILNIVGSNEHSANLLFLFLFISVSIKYFRLIIALRLFG